MTSSGSSFELHRDALHQPLQRQIKLRPAEAADEARRHLVGEHDAVGHLDIGDVVGAGHRAVHAVERPRHRRAQERAVILELIELAAPRMRPSLVTAASIVGDAVRARARRDQMLDAVLDPFHRPAGDLRRERHQHHIGKHRKLDAEAAAGIRRDAQAQFRPGDAQRARHHRMHARTAPGNSPAHRSCLRPDCARRPRRKHSIGVNDSRGNVVVMAMRRSARGEGGRGVAVGEFAHRDFVGLGLRMHERRAICRTRRADRSPLRAARIRSSTSSAASSAI